MADRTYYVYILTNLSRTLYIGMTNNLERRMYEHRMKTVRGFASEYSVSMLAYHEAYSRPSDAIAREKQLKGWSTAKKIGLIESLNPGWEDLAADWFSAEHVRFLDQR